MTDRAAIVMVGGHQSGVLVVYQGTSGCEGVHADLPELRLRGAIVTLRGAIVTLGCGGVAGVPGVEL